LAIDPRTLHATYCSAPDAMLYLIKESNMPLSYSLTGIALTEKFEADGGPSLVAYADKLAGGKPTVGWGHTGKDVVVGATWTYAQCVAALQGDVAWASRVVNTLVHISLTQGEFDALTDFVYNVGAGNFATSTLLKLLNENELAQAALEFDKWDKAKGVVVAGLLRRRQAETAEFNS
jgi:lysozyme